MTDHVALLRAINVGGRNLIRMAALREAVADLGGEDVETYIASGNVLYRAARPLELEAGLSERFGLELKVVVLTGAQLRKVVQGAPEGFGGADHRCDVLFPRKPLTARRVHGLLDPREGIDRAWTAAGVVYFERLAARASGSRLSNFVSEPEYKEVTIRSWGTTQKLAALVAGRS